MDAVVLAFGPVHTFCRRIDGCATLALKRSPKLEDHRVDRGMQFLPDNDLEVPGLVENS
jgi:hypothetical protein